MSNEDVTGRKGGAVYLKALGVPEGEIRIHSQRESRASADPANWPMNRQAEVEAR